MGPRAWLAQLLERNRYGVVARHIASNWLTRRRITTNTLVSTQGSTHLRLPVETSLIYIRTVFEDYMKLGGIKPSDLAGKDVLEVGPGDNLGVSLRFLAAGARSVTCLDRFYSDRDSAQQRRIYSALANELEVEETYNVVGDLISADGEVVTTDPRLSYVYGYPIETAESVLTKQSFDFVVSRAVLEEVHYLDEAMSAMDRLLRPGGIMLHKVDLSDYGMFSDKGMNPLTFLTIPHRLYHWMTSDSANPNRMRISYYREQFEGMGYDTGIRVTRIVGELEELANYPLRIHPSRDYTADHIGLVNAIRGALVAPFRDFGDDELLVSGIFIVARKPD